jgi:hypothetical protein
MEPVIILLLACGVGGLFLIEVLLGNPLHAHEPRLPLRAFATGLLPIFLGGLGVTLAPSRPLAGVLLLVLALGLFVAGRCRRGGSRHCAPGPRA